MNYQNANQHQQQQQGIIEPYTAYQSYQQLPDHGGNAAAQQQQHHHDAQGSLVLAVSGAGEDPAQVIHRPVYTQQQQQPLPLPMPTTKEMEFRPAVPQQKPQKNRSRNNPKPGPTAPETETDKLTAPIVDRVPSGKERRRTQMRIAQRAYRQRKQNELSSRTKQLSERDDVIARMKTAFDALQARLVEADVLGVCPGLEGPMGEMERGFEALGQMATDSGLVAEAASVPTVGGGQVGGGQVDVPVIEAGVVDSNQQRQWTSPDFGSDSSDPFDPLNQSSYPVYGTSVPTQTFGIHQYPNTYQQYTGRTIPITTMNEISLPAPAYISPPTSYSFQETTFARRLMRVCVERAHEVLISGGLPTLSPKEARVFKLAYRIWSRDYLIQKFQMALTGASDLYDPSVPFLPLGGAGTHYVHLRESPPPVSQSMSSSSSSSYTHHHHHHHHQPHLPTEQIVTSGPLTTHTAHIRHDGPDTSLAGIVSSLGLLDDGSEWFDVQDIDGYLQDMGIRLKPHSTTYRFSVPANPAIASRRTVMNQSLLAGVVNQSASGNVMGQEYVPAYVDVERFINCLSPLPTFKVLYVN
ncbi:hypothetical protein EIK77_000291 [Talaromyces pinophilus]|nr:hypothetical protein EIK77_000291 [Talaromyces pinophilus]